MANKYSLFMVAVLSFVLGACSSSQTSSGEGNPEEAPPVEAGTDAVPPVAGAETTTPPPADGAKVPPADQTAAAATTPPPAEGTVPPAPPAETASATPAQAPVTPPAPATDTVASAVQPTTPAAPSSAPAAEGSESYTVQTGDTLMKIAFETYGDLFKWRAIYEANKAKISNPNAVPPGTVLLLDKSLGSVNVSRNGDKYLIKKGDTLGLISEDVYGTKRKWKRLWDNNRELIKDPNLIFAGFYLYYTMTAQDRQEFEQYKNVKEVAPAPLANAAGAPDAARLPASGGAVPSLPAAN